jgi:hypothetical protein
MYVVGSLPYIELTAIYLETKQPNALSSPDKVKQTENDEDSGIVRILENFAALIVAHSWTLNNFMIYVPDLLAMLNADVTDTNCQFNWPCRTGNMVDKACLVDCGISGVNDEPNNVVGEHYVLCVSCVRVYFGMCAYVPTPGRKSDGLSGIAMAYISRWLYW